MIINSLLDNDLYKFTMMQCVLHKYQNVIVKYKFKCRNHEKTLGKNIKNLKEFASKVNDQLFHFNNITLSEDELKYLSTIRFFKPDFINFLKGFKLNPDYVYCYVHNNELHLEIEGPWLHTILFEVPILAIISELYTKEIYPDLSILNTDYVKVEHVETNSHFERCVHKEGNLIHAVSSPSIDFYFSDFGTRRRAFFENHKKIIQTLRKFPNYFRGTSNLFFAKLFDLKAIGTMAHEWIQAHQQLAPIKDSQKIALQVWAEEYRGDLGIALSDTLGFDKFLNEFDMYFAKLFDGCRHDSGDPSEWTEKLIAHYKSMSIDPMTKVAVYSDGLDFYKCKEIHDKFKDQIKISFGVGTWLTNNIGFEPPQNVIKMVRCNGGPVAKISDDPGKAMCNNLDYYNYLRKEVA